MPFLKVAAGGRIGVSAAASLDYDATPAGVSAGMAAASGAIGRLRRGEADALRYSEAERRGAKCR